MNNFELKFKTIMLYDIDRKKDIDKACYGAVHIPDINDIVHANNMDYFVVQKVFNFNNGIIYLFVKELDNE